jgi:thiol-disulfide isomerase/thioredoxin
MKTATFFALMGLILLSLPAAAQQPILAVRTNPEVLELAPGGRISFQIELRNGSTYEADGVETSFTSPETLSVKPEKAVREKVLPFATGVLDFSLDALPGLSPGTQSIPFQVVYSYCIDSSCFQIVEKLSLTVAVVENLSGGLHVHPRGRTPWEFVIAGLGLALFVACLLVGRARRLPMSVHGILLLVVAGALAHGIQAGQARQAQGIATVLCTSCVGIEEARHEAPRLSATAITSLQGLERDVELLVFTAPWCHSCPYAKALVEEMAAATDRLGFRFVNVEDETALARAHGVIASGRTVVPAVVRVDTGEVVFGVENLEARLLRMLGVTP